MSLTSATIIIAAINKAAADLACATVSGGAGTLSVALTVNSDGSGPVTHWAGSGDIPEEILPMMWPSATSITQPADPQSALANHVPPLYMYVEPE